MPGVHRRGLLRSRIQRESIVVRALKGPRRFNQAAYSKRVYPMPKQKNPHRMLPCGSFSFSLRSAKQKGCGSRSLELDVIARIHGPPGVRQKHCRGILADAEHDPFAKNLARQIGPGIADGAAPESVHFVFKPNSLKDVVRMSPLISECTDIIAHLGGLRTSQVHIDDLACPSFNEEVLRRYDHADWPAAHGRKDIEGGV